MSDVGWMHVCQRERGSLVESVTKHGHRVLTGLACGIGTPTALLRRTNHYQRCNVTRYTAMQVGGKAAMRRQDEVYPEQRRCSARWACDV
jgi:hypothetical protein